MVIPSRTGAQSLGFPESGVRVNPAVRGTLAAESLGFGVWRCGIALCVVMLLALVGCEAQSTTAAPADMAQEAAQAVIKPQPTRLRVGMSRTMPPVAFRNNGKTLGLEADFAAALAEELGRELQVVPVFWPELLIELEAKRIDIVMSGMTVTERRQTRAMFCTPYMTVGQMPLMRNKEAAAKLTDRAAVKSYEGRVGVEVDSTGQQWVAMNMPIATVTAMRTLDELVAALIADQIDMVIHDSPAVAWQARQHAADIVAVPVRLTDEPLAWALDRGNAQLLADANAALSRWRDSGQLEQMIDKWIPADVRGAATN